jgi:hypothetical protein
VILLAKGFEALGIACVMIGLVQGIQSDNMWMELYLSIIGIVLFLIGWRTEKWLTSKTSGPSLREPPDPREEPDKSSTDE